MPIFWLDYPIGIFQVSEQFWGLDDVGKALIRAQTSLLRDSTEPMRKNDKIVMLWRAVKGLLFFSLLRSLWAFWKNDNRREYWGILRWPSAWSRPWEKVSSVDFFIAPVSLDYFLTYSAAVISFMAFIVLYTDLLPLSVVWSIISSGNSCCLSFT